jgi:riboflavin transporter FmnP
MLKVSGRSDIFLKLEIFKKILAIPIIIIGIFLGIKIMIAGMFLNTLLAYYLNSHWSGRFIGYSFKDQVVDILPSFGLSMIMGVGVFILGRVLPFSTLWILITQIIVGAVFIYMFCELTKFRDYIYIKELLVEKIREIRKK